MASVGHPGAKREPPTGWELANTVLTSPCAARRLALLILIPLIALVAIVALAAIYLGPVGLGAVATALGGAYGAKRLVARPQTAARQQ